MTEPLEARQAEFQKGYEDFEADDVVRLIVSTGEWLERLLLDPRATEVAMRALHVALIGSEVRSEAPWRELWGELPSSAEFDLRTAQYFVSQNGFAHYGLRPDATFLDLADGSEQALVEGLTACISAGRGILDAVPPGWGAVDSMASTVLAAEGRIALDLGRDVSVEQFAALARVSTKSVRNMLAPKGGASDLRLTSEGRIGFGEALRHLRRRPGFRESLWREAAIESETADGARLASLGEVVFLPVAKDGTAFDPVSCLRAGRYTIGPKGAELDVDDFRTALDALATMPTPYWRRPNPSGNWGLVSGTRWQRRPVSEMPVPEGRSR